MCIRDRAEEGLISATEVAVQSATALLLLMQKRVQTLLLQEATGGRTRKSILSDALEAVIGALYLDGGMDAAKPFILRYILTDIEHKQLFHDSKTILQEVVQADYKKELHYELVDQRGPDHAREFTVEARMDGTVLGVGTGNTKKAAEQEAAYHALIYLRREDAGKIL